MNPLFYLAAFVLALGILVTIHELGHFLVARWCGVKVLRFCIGFGKPLWSKRVGPDQTEWAVAAIPLGGYVKMLDEREGEVASHERQRAFNQQSLWHRSLIVLAGPVANLLLAVLIYTGVFLHGVEEMRPVVGEPVAQSPAARAGFKSGESVRAVDGVAINTWQEFRWAMVQRVGSPQTVRCEVEQGNGYIDFRTLEIASDVELEPETDPLQTLGFTPFQPPMAPVLAAIVADGPAAQAGLLVGDKVLAANGVEVQDWRQVVKAIKASPGEMLRLRIDRQGQVLDVSVLASEVEERGRKIGRIGVAPAPLSEAERAQLLVLTHYSVFGALTKAVQATLDTSLFSLRMMGNMVLGKVSWKNLSGPVTIADYAGQSAQMGLLPYLKFLALISISLGVLNLLPIPLLDGGHLLYHTIEAIKGGPLSEKLMDMCQRLGLGLLGSLMFFALYNDISRLFTR